VHFFERGTLTLLWPSRKLGALHLVFSGKLWTLLGKLWTLGG
jgi:hypothetical protein